MEEFVSRFDQESIEALTVLANSDAEFVLAPSCFVEIGKSLLWVNTLTIPLGSGRAFYLDMTTHEFGMENYFAEISARILNWDWPPYPEVDNPYPVRVRLCKRPAPRVSWEQRVERVSILSRRDEDNGEVAAYDAGIEMLTRDGCTIIAAWPGPNTPGFWLAHAADDINRAISGLDRRLAISRRA